MAISDDERSAGEFLTAPIDDYLLALADGIYKAQRQLGQLSIDLQPGQPAVTYQLPRVDFELKMTYELSQSETGDSSKVLRIRPADARRSSSATSRTEAMSTIKGTFVAVPAQSGRPPAVVRSDVVRLATSTENLARYLITVTVSTAAGERLSGIEVQFNIDRRMSAALSNTAPRPYRLEDKTVVVPAVAATQGDGRATTELTISRDELGAQKLLVVTIDVLDEQQILTFQV
jgi:hypothetical protein